VECHSKHPFQRWVPGSPDDCHKWAFKAIKMPEHTLYAGIALNVLSRAPKINLFPLGPGKNVIFRPIRMTVKMSPYYHHIRKILDE
jgi:hypothetical protein